MGRVAEVTAFYKTKTWQHCRDTYARSRGYMCEECAKHGIASYGEIVHHKIHVDADTIHDPGVTLNHDNLLLLCRRCHAAEHGEMYGKNDRRYKVEGGKLLIIEKN